MGLFLGLGLRANLIRSLIDLDDRGLEVDWGLGIWDLVALCDSWILGEVRIY